MVVTDVGGLAEVVPHEDAGLVVPPEDPPALAAAVVRFFDNGMAPELCVGARRQKEKHSPDRLGEAVETLISGK
jgi:glycosyltransferase involved in cell wall biosynthesis